MPSSNKFNRWGWSVELPGEGTYTFDIWGGAGQCDLSKGTLVGTAEVNYSAGTVNVVYTLNYSQPDSTKLEKREAMFPVVMDV